MSTFTIITVWNKPELFSEFQQELKRQQGVAYTLLGVDNSQNRYLGAREAFLSQMDQVQTEFVVFMHQDIRFQDENALRDLMASAEALEDLVFGYRPRQTGAACGKAGGRQYAGTDGG